MTTRILLEPVSLVLYEDPLWPWCLVAEQRIRAVLAEVDEGYGPLRLMPFPLRKEPRVLTAAERKRLARAARSAAREPEASRTTPDLWLSQDPPLTTVPVLTALAAARLQGASREEALRKAILEAGLVRGINVTRRDVLYELAETSGLDVSRFAGAFAAPATERHVLDVFEDAVDKGVEGAPALVIGDEWLVLGPRTATEYAEVLRRYAATRSGVPQKRTVH
ncbi:MAG TPA: DsbA family protein [Anaeromyxobacter sp.]|nr:DsbA family protein [Anaeromyxobacter sp.]